MNRNKMTAVAIIALFSLSLASAHAAEDGMKRERGTIKAVPVEKAIKTEGKTTVLQDKLGRQIVIDEGVFKLPTEIVEEIAARGKKKKGGGGGGAPPAPKPSNCVQVGPCTESNWTQSCGNGGSQECKQWLCYCSAEGGGSYKSGPASCGACQGGGGGGGTGGIGGIPETQTIGN